MKRVLLYVAVGVAAYVFATLFVESQLGFIVVFGAAVLILVAAEVLFWIHVVRLSLPRRRH